MPPENKGKAKLRHYPGFEEWSRDFPEQAKLERESIARDFFPGGMSAREIESALARRFASRVLKEYIEDGLMYQDEAGAFFYTDLGQAELGEKGAP